MLRDWTIRDASSQKDWEQAVVLLDTVYVGEGFAQPQFAQQTFNRDRLKNEGDFLVAAASGGTILGAVLLLSHQSGFRQISRPGETEFRLLAVSDAARGNGIGRKLVQECLNRSKSRGARITVLCTQPSMRAAQALYEGLGFRRRTERDFQVADGGSRWVYSIDLD